MLLTGKMPVLRDALTGTLRTENRPDESRGVRRRVLRPGEGYGHPP
jgi:hypothetical protein